jgi:hypothetical protein
MRRRSDSASTSAERLAASAIACRWLILQPRQREKMFVAVAKYLVVGKVS